MGHARRGRHRKRKRGRAIALIVLLLLVAALGAGVGLAVHYPQTASQLIHRVLPGQADGDPVPPVQDGSASVSAQPGVSDAGDDSAGGDGREVADEMPHTRQIAAYGDVKIYSPIAQEDITGVLFHQASYDTALVMTTELPEADVEKISVEHPVRVNNEQVDGDWVDADALHLYRTTDVTAMDTSLDVGAKAGSTVYAPVTGTVVLVKDYDLYGYVPDIEVHIQPEGHPELDLVMIHQSDTKVKKGDKVAGGVTPVSSVRDIAKDLTDIQLSFFTAEDDPGNHSHIQVNNADSPGYREEKLQDAYQVED